MTETPSSPGGSGPFPRQPSSLPVPSKEKRKPDSGSGRIDREIRLPMEEDGPSPRSRSGNLRIFGPTGRHLATFGGQGEGPGEFNRPRLTGALPGDTLVVVDRSNRSTPYGIKWGGSSYVVMRVGGTSGGPRSEKGLIASLTSSERARNTTRRRSHAHGHYFLWNSCSRSSSG